VTFDGLETAATLDGVRLAGEGLPIRLEGIGSSELLLFERQGTSRGIGAPGREERRPLPSLR